MSIIYDRLISHPLFLYKLAFPLLLVIFSIYVCASGIMVEETQIPTPVSEPTPPTTSTGQTPPSTTNSTLLQPPVPSVSSVLPTPTASLVRPLMTPVLPGIPPIAPLPTVPPPAIRPLAPLPIRPPLVRPPPGLTNQNGEANGSDSGSDHEGSAAPSTLDYEITEESRLVRERHEKAMQDLLTKRRAYALAVPTNDSAVRTRLRRLGEPITVFGEREMERRDRLRMIMVRLDAEGQLEKLLKAHEDEEVAAAATEEDGDEGPQSYPFYTEGSKALLEARIEIAKYSIRRAASRLERARRKRDDPDEDLDAEMDCVLKQAGDFILNCSEFGDDRPLSGCSFSNDGKLLATRYFCLCILFKF